jgi:hypothetical protein
MEFGELSIGTRIFFISSVIYKKYEEGMILSRYQFSFTEISHYF